MTSSARSKLERNLGNLIRRFYYYFIKCHWFSSHLITLICFLCDFSAVNYYSFLARLNDSKREQYIKMKEQQDESKKKGASFALGVLGGILGAAIGGPEGAAAGAKIGTEAGATL